MSILRQSRIDILKAREEETLCWGSILGAESPELIYGLQTVPGKGEIGEVHKTEYEGMIGGKRG